ncbi:head morphogenesis [Idiomarinaceae phage Phi1M2-2]|uniref:head morphogenesis n=1 Tax=Idiomarinaceae phage Phi1M2-2 TaxID=1527515 RepID=UPI0004F60B6E|nr:head morphogenesis [Idiomarinaceae phage Phi1M2-2]AIM40762.1 putative capsid morphogenesis protein [Idiomarinaceae phage Phi1M2-2]
MPNLNINQILQHELQIARLATGQINSVVVPSLESTYAEIRRLISESGMPRTRGELRKLESAIRQAIQDNAGWATFTATANEFAAYEASVYQGIIDTLTGQQVSPIAEGKLQRYVTSSLMTLESGQRVQTGTWSEFVRANVDSRTREINNVVRTAYSRGWGTRQLGRELRTRFDGVLRRESETLARTGYSHYSNAAREAMGEQYSIAMEWVLIVTFDSRTSDTCRFYAANPEQRWDKNDPDKPVPPLHFGCRTSGLLIPKGTDLTGTRASVGMTADGERDPKQIRANTSYESFLRRQPVAFQNEVLGEQRARLFRQGDMELKSFYDMTGRQLTLDELRQRDPDIWRGVFG